MAGRGDGVFVEETEGKGIPERANGAGSGLMQHCRGSAGTPEDLAAEGKAILTLRHNSADEVERQLRQPSHTHPACRNMPMLAPKIWADKM